MSLHYGGTTLLLSPSPSLPSYAVAQEQIKVTVAFWHSLVEEKEAVSVWE